jgi:hypothetical protein
MLEAHLDDVDRANKAHFKSMMSKQNPAASGTDKLAFDRGFWWKANRHGS